MVKFFRDATKIFELESVLDRNDPEFGGFVPAIHEMESLRSIIVDLNNLNSVTKHFKGKISLCVM